MDESVRLIKFLAMRAGGPNIHAPIKWMIDNMAPEDFRIHGGPPVKVFMEQMLPADADRSISDLIHSFLRGFLKEKCGKVAFGSVS